MLAYAIVSPIPFFMDNILTSTVCQYYCEHGFGNFILPTLIDAGHPPLFYLYISIFWKILGVSVATAHIAMIPFMLLFLWSSLQIISAENGKGYLLFFPLFVAPILAQFTMPSYDFAMTALGLAAISAIQKNQRLQFFILLSLISLISLRGILLSFSIAVCFGYYYHRINRKFVAYGIVTIIPLVLWHFYHYSISGWAIITPSTHWQSQRNLDLLQYIFPNLIAWARCFIDNGMLIVSIVFMYFIYKNKNYRFLFLLSVFVLINVFPLLFTSNPILQRYLLIVYTLMALRVALYINKERNGKIMLSILGIILLSANLFYCKRYSNSWDTNAFYAKYFKGTSAIDTYCKEHNISKLNCASSFPVFNTHKQVFTFGDTIRMQDVLEIPLGSTSYIIYSNACNAMESDLMIEIKKKYKLEKSFIFYPFNFYIYHINNDLSNKN
jgi:hypothetical protein